MLRERVTVTGGDYTYQGDIVSIFTKRSGAVRYVVEDDNGRLFIHNATQLGLHHELPKEIVGEEREKWLKDNGY